MEKKTLGKGLSALIPEQNLHQEPNGSSTTYLQSIGTENVMNISLEKIIPNRFQPRENYDEEKFNDLIASIRENGIIQPILVRQSGGGYEIIAGERRYRAAKSLGMQDIPAIVKQATDTELLEYALIENLQRQDLNPIEEAKGYEKLIQQFGFTQEVVAQRVGKDRASVTNCLRILKLPQSIQKYVSGGTISAGHAKVLLSIENPKSLISMAKKCVHFAWSVRKLEQAVKNLLEGKKSDLPKDSNIISLEKELQQILGTRVRITHGKKTGHIEIEYYSLEDLDRVLNIFRNSKK
jgi:ParB family chromosome partitioning protein